jgi:hypothetical protein
MTEDSGFLRDAPMGFLADCLDDLEKVRMATANRLRILTLPKGQLDKDGKSRGHGLPLELESVQFIVQHLAALKEYEDDVLVPLLEKTMRAHPLGEWQRRTSGIGAKQLARLLGAIGDPYWHDAQNRPRTVRELWAYSGLDVRGGVAPSRVAGRKSDWNGKARMRAWNVAGSCVQALTSPYRVVYDEAKAHYEGGVHTNNLCRRCTGKSKPPAEIGTPLKKAHVHARALRAIMKAVEKDLWLEAKRIHESVTGQGEVAA